MTTLPITFKTPNHQNLISAALQQSDKDIARLIQRRLPDGIYNAISVSTISYDFCGVPGAKLPTRLITLKVDGDTAKFFRAFFSGMLGMHGKDYKEVDRDAVQDQIFEMLCPGGLKNLPQINNAYAHAASVEFYIAINLSSCELKVNDSKAIPVGYAIGALLTLGIPCLFSRLLFSDQGAPGEAADKK